MVIKLFYLSKTESEMAISCVSCWKESYHQQISGLKHSHGQLVELHKWQLYKLLYFFFFVSVSSFQHKQMCVKSINFLKVVQSLKYKILYCLDHAFSELFEDSWRQSYCFTPEDCMNTYMLFMKSDIEI